MRPQDGAGREIFELSLCPAGPCKSHGGSFGLVEDGEQRRSRICLRASPFLLGKEPEHGRGRSSSLRQANRFGRKCCCWLIPGRTWERGSPGIREVEGRGEPRERSAAPARLCCHLPPAARPGGAGNTDPHTPYSENHEKQPFLSFQRETFVLRQQRICLKSSCPGQGSRKPPAAWLHPRNTSQEHVGMFVCEVSSADERLIRPGSGWGIPEIRSELSEPASRGAGARANSRASAGA